VDAIDRRLLDLLRANARLSYAELARQVGLSAPAVHERVGKLEAAGTIRGYRADVLPEAVGLGVTAIIGVVQDSGGDTKDVLDALERMAAIESCYFMAGEESFLATVRVGTIAELEQRRQVIVRHICVWQRMPFEAREMPFLDPEHVVEQTAHCRKPGASLKRNRQPRARVRREPSLPFHPFVIGVRHQVLQID